jgi:signal transduction histidine kinase
MVEFLKGEGINVALVTDADTAFEEALLHRPNVVLIDDRVPPAGGIELCQRLKGNTRTHFLPAILYAQTDVRQHRLRALAAGADAIFVPSTDEQERRTRLWALLRTQAIYRRQERKQRTQGAVIQERRRWVGSFVHDLQSSIGALQANFEYLSQALLGRGRPATPELDECLRDSRTVFKQVVRGLRTVLDFERFEVGRIVLRDAPVSLGELCETSKDELAWQASATGRTIDLQLSPHEQPVHGDPDYLREAILNLMAFSLRQPGNRTVLVKVWSAGGVTRLSVQGEERIPADERQRIFEPYARTAKQAPVGHGLGLALARIVVELHGGSIWVEDVPEGGSAFVIELKADGAAPKFRTVG